MIDPRKTKRLGPNPMCLYPYEKETFGQRDMHRVITMCGHGENATHKPRNP